MQPLTIENITQISLESFMEENCELNSDIRTRMRKLLMAGIENELTQRQRDCMQMYYFEKLDIADIASQLHIRPTTVYKHLKLAKRALRKCAAYL